MSCCLWKFCKYFCFVLLVKGNSREEAINFLKWLMLGLVGHLGLSAWKAMLSHIVLPLWSPSGEYRPSHHLAMDKVPPCPLCYLKMLELSRIFFVVVVLQGWTGISFCSFLCKSSPPALLLQFAFLLFSSDFANEYLTCDCHLRWILAWSKSHSVQVSDKTVCVYPSHLHGKLLRNIRESQLRCGEAPSWVSEFAWCAKEICSVVQCYFLLQGHFPSSTPSFIQQMVGMLLPLSMDYPWRVGVVSPQVWLPKDDSSTCKACLLHFVTPRELQSGLPKKTSPPAPTSSKATWFLQDACREKFLRTSSLSRWESSIWLFFPTV